MMINAHTLPFNADTHKRTHAWIVHYCSMSDKSWCRHGRMAYAGFAKGATQLFWGLGELHIPPRVW